MADPRLTQPSTDPQSQLLSEIKSLREEISALHATINGLIIDNRAKDSKIVELQAQIAQYTTIITAQVRAVASPTPSEMDIGVSDSDSDSSTFSVNSSSSADKPTAPPSKKVKIGNKIAKSCVTNAPSMSSAKSSSSAVKQSAPPPKNGKIGNTTAKSCASNAPSTSAVKATAPPPKVRPDNDGFTTVSYKRRPSTPECESVAFKKTKPGKKASEPTATTPSTPSKAVKIDSPKTTVVAKTTIPSVDNIDDMGASYTSNPPAITLLDKKSWDAISRQLTTLKVVILKCRFFPDCVKFVVQKPEHYRAAVKFLATNNIQFFSHPLNEEKNIRVVIRNVDTTISDSSIVAQLKALDLPVLSVRRMCNSSRLFPMVSVHLENTPAGREIYNLAKLSHAPVKVEKQKPSHRQPQCHKCQLFGHSSARCNISARCVKCAGPHITADCTRKNPEADGPPTCCNCGEAHTANYRGCAKYPKPTYARAAKSNTAAAPQQPQPQRSEPQRPQQQPTPPATNQVANLFAQLANPNILQLIERLEKLAPTLQVLSNMS